jgi:pimeloyl-ACP methyl ester carboxylesterase
VRICGVRGRNSPFGAAATRENGRHGLADLRRHGAERTDHGGRCALLRGRPPATGAWRDGDPAGDRRFAAFGAFTTEGGRELPGIRIAYETWGELSPARDNAVLVLHALTGDSHVRGAAGPGHPTAVVGRHRGPRSPIDTDRWFVVAPNMLGGCQGSTGPSSIAPDGYEWAGRFPYLTIRDQVAAQARLADNLGVQVWAAVIGGSMGGMHALEWGVGLPDRVARLAVLSSPPTTTADQIALNGVQLEAIQIDPRFADGEYYDAPDGGGRTAASRSHDAWPCSTTAAPPSSTSASSARGSRARARSVTAGASPWRAISTSTATSSRGASTRTRTSRWSRP